MDASERPGLPGLSAGAGEAAAEESATMLRIMPREMRMMSERILSLSGLPRGFILALRDVPMYSQLLRLGGMALLEARLEALAAADPRRLRIAEECGPELQLDGGAQHAWIALPSLLDLAAELVARHGQARLVVREVIDPAELQVASALAARSALQLRSLASEAAAGTLAFQAGPRLLSGELREDDPLLAAALMHGSAIEPALWWRIYQLAQQALEPDNPVSRRHAGTVMVLEDGRIVGRADGDDETDFSFIAAASREPQSSGEH